MKIFYIYLITNLINGKVYVGKTNKPQTRWRNHKKIASGGREKYPKEFSAVHGAIKKYGTDNFTFEILEEIDDERESYISETRWIISLGSSDRQKGYNLNLGGEGGIQPTDEVIQKLIAFQNSLEMLKLHSDLMKQRHLQNPGFLSRINKGNKYRENKLHSLDTKAKMSISHKNNNYRGEKIANSKLIEEQVIEIRKRYETENITQRQLSIIYGVSQSVISDVITKKLWGHI